MKRGCTRTLKVSDRKAKSALTLVNVSKGGQPSISNITDFNVIYILQNLCVCFKKHNLGARNL